MRCLGCGESANPENPQPSHCHACPPWRCDDCGQMDSTDNPCPCWISLKGMALADIKAVFARDTSPGPSLTIGP
jgi:hypothetical protein